MWIQKDTAVRAPARLLILVAMLMLAAACLTLGLPARAAGDVVTVNTRGQAYEVKYHVKVPIDAVTFGSQMGFDTVTLEGAGYLKQPGLPRLPARTVWIAVPSGMKVTGVREIAAKTAVLPGTYNILPAQLPRAITGTPLVRPIAEPDPDVYASPSPYPARRVSFVRQSDLAGQNLAAILVCPIQYSPASGTLTVATEIEVMMEGEPGYTCADYVAPRASRRSRAMYERMLESMVVNPQDICITDAFAGPVLRGVEPGEYEYVIVTTADWLNAFQPLADWRTKQGWKVNVVTTGWIYDSAGYSGTDLEKMRAFIIDAHTNWGATHFVLASDVDNIPYHVRSITVPTWGTDDIPNDTYYADYDEDWVLEVVVGRLSVRNTDHIASILDKIFTYEKNPPLTDYVKTAFFVGMDITVCGDMSGQIFKEDYIRSMHLPGTWSLYTEYDSEPGTHRADIIAYLEQGYHLVNHHDHCNADCMGAGWTCHSDLFYTTDMDALTNGDRLSIFFAVGCFPAHIPTTKCIGEAAIRNPNGAGVAFMGNTSYGWGGDDADPDFYSLRQDRYFYRNLFDLGIYNLGENFTRLKNDEYDPVDPYNLHQYAFTQLHLIGDPGLTVWTDDPQGLTVAHPPEAMAGEPTTFDVEVSGGGGPLDGASVCLYKEGEIHEVEHTIAGVASFEFTAATAGTLYVTVCSQNYIPYEGISIVDPPASVEGLKPGMSDRLMIVSAVPTPFTKSTRITYAVPASGRASLVTVAIYDCLGRRIRTLQAGILPPGIHHLEWDGLDHGGNDVASGIYHCEVRWQGKRDVRQLVLLR